MVEGLYGAIFRGQKVRVGTCIPKRLKRLAPDASGSDKLTCWTMGGGTFEAGPLNDELPYF